MWIKAAKVSIQEKYLLNVIYKIILCIFKYKWNVQKDTTIVMQENAFVCKNDGVWTPIYYLCPVIVSETK